MDEILSRKPVEELDKKFPEYQFMIITDNRDNSMRLVAMTYSLTKEALYAEKELPDLDVQDAVALYLINQLEIKKDKRRWQGGQLIQAAHSPEEWQAIKEEKHG